MVALTDGMYLSHGLTEVLALRYLERAPFELLLRGHGGELAKMRLAWPLHTDAQVYQLETTDRLIDHLMQRYSTISGVANWTTAFTDSWKRSLTGSARASLQEALRDVMLPPPELCTYLYLSEHHRRFTIASLELFRNAVAIRMPFVDLDFVKTLLSGPTEWHDTTDLHRAVIARFDRRLLGVRDSNTGAAIDAGPITSLIGDKLNSLFKRLHIRGYRHYHSFDAWMEQMLIDAVEPELMSARSLDRGVLDAAGVRTLIDGAKAGRHGYASLLQVLLILELWQQATIDAY
jgi:asparagine synthase (glutamine-hydrolysing)